MPNGRGAVVGRSAELAAVDEVAGQPALVLVRGDAGMGKTALLGELSRRWRTSGARVVQVRCSGEIPSWDLFGAHAVVAAFRSRFHEIGDSRTAGGIAAVVRLCRPETYASDSARSALFAELVRLFTGLRATGAGAVLIDDLQLAPAPALTPAAAQRAGCTVVATCREGGADEAGTSLRTLADRVVDLGPLSGPEVDDLLAAAAGEPLDEAVVPALRDALGEPAANPGTVLETFELLRHDGGLVPFRGRLCLRDPAATPALPPTHGLVRQVRRYGALGGHLLALAAGAARFTVDDLPLFAAATGQDLLACGNAVDLLVAAGALACDDRGALSAACPALVAAVTGRNGDEIADVHRAIAEHLMAGAVPVASSPASAREIALADHLALAGGALPGTPAVGTFLAGLGAQARSARPLPSARWYRAALRHHQPGTAERAQVVTALLSLSTRLADYDLLAEVVAEVTSTGFDEHQRDELAAGAASAAVHIGQPVPTAVHRKLAGGPASRRPLDFAGRWFSGGNAFLRQELMAAFAADGATGTDEPGDTAGAGSDLPDPAGWFARAIGEEYGKPVAGPLAAYDRIVRCYRRGEWSGLLSEARALELAGGTGTPVHLVARLLAAEVCAARGDFPQAGAWLGQPGEAHPFPALRTWAAMGVDFRRGDWDRARKSGWATLEQLGAGAGGNGVGIGRLLIRLAFFEGAAGSLEKLPELHAQARRWNAEFGGIALRAAELITRGLAERDYADARTAADILREHGDLSELMGACMTAASLADDPGPWYQEAYEIAKRLGGPLQHTRIRESMLGSGVTPRRARTGSGSLSELESRMVELVRQGLTNRQIAGALKVTEKTVESNLTRIFAKTGSRSRLDLALASMEGRLATDEPRTAR